MEEQTPTFHGASPNTARFPGTDIPMDQFENYYEDDDSESRERYEQRKKEFFREQLPRIPEDEENEISNASGRDAMSLRASQNSYSPTRSPHSKFSHSSP